MICPPGGCEPPTLLEEMYGRAFPILIVLPGLVVAFIAYKYIKKVKPKMKRLNALTASIIVWLGITISILLWILHVSSRIEVIH